MKLRLVVGKVAPRSGTRTEHFYAGQLTVVNDEVETDNPNWINQLRERGYKPVEEMTATEREMYPDLRESAVQESDVQENVAQENTAQEKDEDVVGEVHQEEPVEPQGTQVVNEETFEDFKEVEPQTADEGPVSESHTDEPFHNSEDFWASLDDEPSDLERLMSESLGDTTLGGRRRPSRHERS